MKYNKIGLFILALLMLAGCKDVEKPHHPAVVIAPVQKADIKLW
ncbi:hypothetical protein [Carboxylicivirga marina]